MTAEFTVDFARERQVVFDQAWTLLRDNFFDRGVQRRELGGLARTVRPRARPPPARPTNCAA